MLKTNCKDCYYRQLLAADDCHVWGEDCDHYDDDFCKKMNNPDFVEWMKTKQAAKGGKHANV